ncbi:YkgJ family cysteine cluster protein [Candidatus Woesearchaeota archaeon]|nr:YkgJ family cysteine cluster protein [Candidatus Woesearchaeota archaeon]
MITKNTSQEKILGLAPPCRCDACSHGCTMGSGVFAEGEVKKAAAFFFLAEQKFKEKFLEKIFLFNKEKWKPKLLREGKPYGRCVFFDKQKGCTIHPVKPLQCKIAMGCKPCGEDLQKWFLLNHLVDVSDAQSIRDFASYLKSGGKTIPGGSLEEMVPDKERLKKILGYEIMALY